MKKQLLIIAGIFVIIGALTIVGARAIYKDNKWIFDQLGSFSVHIVNQSDSDFAIIEAGILQSDSQGNTVESGSKDDIGKTLESGEKLTVKPDLNITGEGGIYLKMSDANDETVTHIVCSYTESLSGKTKVTVTNDDVEIDQSCS